MLSKYKVSPVNLLFFLMVNMTQRTMSCPSSTTADVILPPCKNHSRSFTSLHERLYLALYSSEQAERGSRHLLGGKYLIMALETSSNDAWISAEFEPSSLEEIYRFDTTMNTAMRRNTEVKVVVSAGAEVKHQMKVIFLLGCHMIMSHGLDSEQTHRLFASFEEFFAYEKCGQSHLISSWRAINRAKAIGWIDFRERFELDQDEPDAIDMEEYIHYSR